MKRNLFLKLALAVSVLLIALISANAQQEDKTVRVRFKKGANSATYKDSVSHSVNTYIVHARKGQTIIVSISAPSNNATFNVGTRYENAGDVVEIVNEQRKWTGKADETGDYQISVLAARGSSSYAISISVR